MRIAALNTWRHIDSRVLCSQIETQHKSPSLAKGFYDFFFLPKKKKEKRKETLPPERSNRPSDTDLIESAVQKVTSVGHEGRVVEVAVYVCEARIVRLRAARVDAGWKGAEEEPAGAVVVGSGDCNMRSRGSCV